jgi:molybdopterin molybdotransferase
MTELFTVHTPPAPGRALSNTSSRRVRSERIATADALERVLAEQLVAPQDLPEFARATVDGYAVAAADTYGATPGLPAFLDLAGEVPMGQAAAFALDPGAARPRPHRRHDPARRRRRCDDRGHAARRRR